MALDRAPNALRLGQPAVGTDQRFTRDAHTSLEELWRQVVAGFVVVPCEASTALNVITLTPRLHEEGGVNYGTGMIWSFVADATSTGAVTASVGGLDALKVYTNSGALQAGSGIIVSGSTYLLIYDAALDSGAGGFVAFGSIDIQAGTGILVTDAGNSATVAIDGATQANQEAGTVNKVVTSDVQQFHPSAAKAWCSFDVAGNLGESYNVSSITDNGTGNWTVNIATDFSSQFWSGVAMGSLKNGVAWTATCCIGITAGTFTINVVRADTGAPIDPDTPNLIGFVGFGDQ